jgi:hypothetical protein
MKRLTKYIDGKIITEYSAADLTAYALDALRLKGYRVRRVNNIPHNKRFKNNTEPGWPDIQGYSRTDGRIVLCEVKKRGDKLSDAQRERLTDCHNCNGIALICFQNGNNAEVVNFIDYGSKD